MNFLTRTLLLGASQPYLHKNYIPMHYQSIALFSLLIMAACTSQPDPQTIVAQAIEAHGGQQYDGSHISFDF